MIFNVGDVIVDMSGTVGYIIAYDYKTWTFRIKWMNKVLPTNHNEVLLGHITILVRDNLWKHFPKK